MQLRFIADMHISPLTVKELQKNGYDIIRVTDKLPATASDTEIVQLASEEQAVIITQDLDFSAIVAQSGLSRPSVISLRVANARPHIILVFCFQYCLSLKMISVRERLFQ